MSKSIIKRTVALLVTMIAVCSWLLAPASVYAYEDMDMSRNGNGSLTLQLPAPSSNVKLYFVADMDGQTHITMKDEYKALGVTIDDADTADDWASKAAILSNQLIGTDIQPMTTATDENNQAVFKDLSFGIYLVVVDECKNESTSYKVTPNFVSVPYSTDGETWIYDVSATVKYEAEPTSPPPPPGKDKYIVKKLWTKDGTGTTRPTEIKVRILKDGNEVETVSLNKNNSWTYSWETEADGAKWEVQEVSLPSNYTLDKLDGPYKDDKTGVFYFTLTNKYLTPTPTPKTKITPTPTTKVNKTPTPTHKVPKTGDDQNILLPVIGVLAAGLVLVLLGMNIRRKSGKDE